MNFTIHFVLEILKKVTRHYLDGSKAYVMKGGKKQFKNVYVLCETENGRFQIGWSQRTDDDPFRRLSL